MMLMDIIFDIIMSLKIWAFNWKETYTGKNGNVGVFTSLITYRTNSYQAFKSQMQADTL